MAHFYSFDKSDCIGNIFVSFVVEKCWLLIALQTTGLLVTLQEQGIMSEWLRRWIRNPLGFTRAGSNPVDTVFNIFLLLTRTRQRSNLLIISVLAA